MDALELKRKRALAIRERRRRSMSSYFEDPNELSALDQRVATAMNPKQFTPKMETDIIEMQSSYANTGMLQYQQGKMMAGAGVALKAAMPVSTLAETVRGNPEEQSTGENIARGAGSFAVQATGMLPLTVEQIVSGAVTEKNPAKPIEDMIGSIADTYKRQFSGEGGGMTRSEAWSKTPVEETLNLAAPVLALLPFAKGFLGKRGATIKVAPEQLAQDIADMGFDVQSIEKPAVRTTLEKRLIEKYGKGIDEKGQPIADEVGVASERDIAKEMGRQPVKQPKKGKGTTAIQQELTKDRVIEKPLKSTRKEPPTPEQVKEADVESLILGDRQAVEPTPKPQTPQTISEGVSQRGDTPLRIDGLYHGTKSSFENFDIAKAGQTDAGLVGKALYFTPTKEQALSFANNPFYGTKTGGEARIVEASVSLKRPLIIQDGHFPDGRSLTDIHKNGITKQSANAIEREIKSGGYDGVVFKLGDDITQVAVYDKGSIVNNQKPSQRAGKISTEQTVQDAAVRPAQSIKTQSESAPLMDYIQKKAIDFDDFNKLYDEATAIVRNDPELLTEGKIDLVYRAARQNLDERAFAENSWQRTREQIRQETLINPLLNTKGSGVTLKGAYGNHHTAVDKALANGKPVPPEVLADYPDLAAKYGKQGGDISLGALGTPDAYQAIGETISKGVDWTTNKFQESQLKGLARLTTSVAERFKSPAAKELVGEIDRNMGLQMRLIGQASEALIETHFQKMSKAEANNFSAIMRGGTVKPISDRVASMTPVGRSLLEKMHEVATGAGMDIGKLENYWPNMLKHKVAVKLREDIGQFIAEAENAIKAKRDAGEMVGLSSDEALLKVFKDMEYLQDGLNPETVAIIKEGIKNGKSFPHTMLELRNYMNDDPVMPFGNLEKHRRLSIPSQFYETDARIIMGKYINGWARRVAETAQWGKQNRKITEMLMKVQTEAPQEYSTASKLFDTYIGKFAPEQYMTGGTRKAVGNVMGGTVATLGAGFATFLNMFQIGISAMPKAGLLRTIKTSGQLAKGIYESKIAGDYSQYLRGLRETGAPYTANALEMLGGVLDGDTIGELAANKALKYSGFTGVNKINQYAAAGVAKSLIDDLIPLANSKSIRAKWAQKTLKEDFKIDYTQPISTNQKLEAIGRWANDSQLQRNVLRDPLWMNQPNLKFWATFKKFPFRQAQFAFKDIIVKEIKRGNAMPMLRLLSAGILGGEAAIWAMNKTKEFLSGDPHYRKEDWSEWERYANDIAAVGSLGMFTDVFKINSTLPEDQIVEAAENSLKLLSPVFLEKIYGATVGRPGGKDTGGIVGTMQETAKHGAGAGMSKFLEEVSSQLGAIPASLGKRTKSDESQERGDKFKRGQETKAIAYLMLKGKDREADRRIELWMQNYPELPIEPDALESAIEKLIMNEDSE